MLCIERIAFDETDGSVVIRSRSIRWRNSRTRRCFTKWRTFSGTRLNVTSRDTEETPSSLREVEAESVALLCCEALGLEGADYARGDTFRTGYITASVMTPTLLLKKAQKTFAQLIKSFAPDDRPKRYKQNKRTNSRDQKRSGMRANVT